MSVLGKGVFTLHSLNNDCKISLDIFFVRQYMPNVLFAYEESNEDEDEGSVYVIPNTPTAVLLKLKEWHDAIKSIRLQKPGYKHEAPLFILHTDDHLSDAPLYERPLSLAISLTSVPVLMGLCLLGNFLASDWLVDTTTGALARMVNLQKKYNKFQMYKDIFDLSWGTPEDRFTNHRVLEAHPELKDPDGIIEKDFPWMFL